MFNDEEWNRIALLMGFKSEKDMWDNLYSKTNLGSNSISNRMSIVVDYAPTPPTVSRRLKALGYQTKKRGGARYRKSKIERIIEVIGSGVLEFATTPEAIKIIGITLPSTFHKYASKHNLKYIKKRAGRPKNEDR